MWSRAEVKAWRSGADGLGPVVEFLRRSVWMCWKLESMQQTSWKMLLSPHLCLPRLQMHWTPIIIKLSLLREDMQELTAL